MRKIPTLFKREFENHNVVSIMPECISELAWVLNGEGIATEKHDGSCCAIINGAFYKRYDAKRNRLGIFKQPPSDAIPCDKPDPVTGHWPHWLPVKGDASDKWFVEAKNNVEKCGNILDDGTYEAIGPHFQNNPYALSEDTLIRHGSVVIDVPDRSFEGIKKYLSLHNIEGIVFWKDGQPRCKIKRSDFGFRWPAYETISVEMSQEEKEKLLSTISDCGWTIDGLTNVFLKWIVDYPDEAVMCIKKWKESQS